jgi:macrolide phosphotransferase
MARSHFTLAALATAAVPGADIVSTRPITTQQSGRFDSAVLGLRDGGTLIIRIPTSQDAELEQSGDLVALHALTAGFRERLPFTVPTVKGQAPVGDTRAVVYEFIPGSPFSLAGLDPRGALTEAIGTSIAAIHSLPTSVVTDSGLAFTSAADAARATRAVKDRAAATGVVPVDLLTRWSIALEDSALWQFQPTVIHGALAPEAFLVSGEVVTGVTSWAGLRVGDPAADLYWLSSAPDEQTATRIFGSYNLARNGPVDRQLRKRARLYAELEIAKWLLHGLGVRDQGIIADATTMLEGLSASVGADLMNPLSTDTGQIMAIEEVEEMLSHTPRNATSPQSASEHVNSANRISED